MPLHFTAKSWNPENGMKSKQNMGKWKVTEFLRELQSCIYPLPQDDVRTEGQLRHREGPVVQDRSQVRIKNSLFPSFWHDLFLGSKLISNLCKTMYGKLAICYVTSYTSTSSTYPFQNGLFFVRKCRNSQVANVPAEAIPTNAIWERFSRILS